MARPTKLTPKLIDAIVADLERGVHQEVVAHLHGINPDTFYTWRKEGARERERVLAKRRHPTGTDRKVKDRLRLCAEFSERCERACAQVEAAGIEVWLASFEIREVLRYDGEPILDDDGNPKTIRVGTDWRAIQAYMERRFPDRWKARSEQALTGADGGPIRSSVEADVNVAGKLTPDELRQALDLKRKLEDG